MSGRGSPWQRFYGWAHERRRSHWATRSVSLGRPVVSVGNLHWGGSGKTPTVIAAARGLGRHGVWSGGPASADPVWTRRPDAGPEAAFRVAVLSRGYRRRGRGPLLVSLGDGPVATVEEAGDEPVMIAEQAPGVVVAVGADRRAAAALALERAPDIDVFLLDDGFSHLRVRRDVEVLTFPAADPFAGGLLLPGGRLREPLSMVRLANAAVLTGVEPGALLPSNLEAASQRGGLRGDHRARRDDAETVADFERTLRRHGFEGRVFTSALQPKLGGGPLPERPLLVTGVARPERVAGTAAAAGLDCVDHLRFADHHGYPPRSLRAIESACIRHGCDAVVVTSKDAVKLRGRLLPGTPPLRELQVETRFDPEFLPWLGNRLKG